MICRDIPQFTVAQLASTRGSILMNHLVEFRTLLSENPIFVFVPMISTWATQIETLINRYKLHFQDYFFCI